MRVEIVIDGLEKSNGLIVQKVNNMFQVLITSGKYMGKTLNFIQQQLIFLK